MRKLTLIITTALLFSCGNKKAEIVELIKDYKDSSKSVSVSILQLTIEDTKRYEELYFTNGKSDYNKVRNSDIGKEYRAYKAKTEQAQWELKIKQLHYKSVIDSLELELKKY